MGVLPHPNAVGDHCGLTTPMTGCHAPFIPRRAFITGNNINNYIRGICLGIDLPWEDYSKGKFAQHSRSSFVV